MTVPLLIGLDIGTSRVKALAMTVDGDIVVEVARPTPWRHAPEGAEMDAVQLGRLVVDVTGRAATDAVAAMAATGEAAAVLGLGATGMGESGALLDAQDRPLAPIRAWHDRRADVATVRAEIGDRSFHRAVGMHLDTQPSLPKLLRLRREFPESVAAVRFLSVPEWAVRVLGGRVVSELSLASRTGLLDVVTARPWAAAAELLGGDLLGELVLAGTDCGHAAGEGVPAALQGAVLTVGGHDHQTAALGAGAAGGETLFDSLGTAEALLRFAAGDLPRDSVERLARQRITVGRTVVAGQWCVIQGLSSGQALERVATALGVTGREERLELGRRAVPLLGSPAETSCVQVEVPGGEVRISLVADGGPAGPEAIWAAAVDAVVASAGPGLSEVQQVVGPHRRVVAAGGWLANAAVLTAKQRQFPGLVTSSVTEAGAAGAAYLAGVARGLLPAPTAGAPLPWGSAAPSTA
jgi:sugar (pentulose or hexulose) kinase